MFKNNDTSKGNLDRRTFVKGAVAAAAATVAADGVAFAQEAAEPAEEEDWYGNPGVPGYMCCGDWLGQAPVIDPSEIVATYEADIIVCGSGHAGTQCALAAAQGGASVMVLELQAEDKYMAQGGGVCTFNSKWATDLGLGGYDIGEITAEYTRRAGQTANAELIRQYIANSGEMLDNLVSITPEESTQFKVQEGHEGDLIQIAYDKPKGSDYPVELGGFKMWAACYFVRMTELETNSRNAAKALGAQWFFERYATVLVQNENGDVTGVIAKGPDGYEQFNANKGVVISTGDFADNLEMIVQLLDLVNELDMRNNMDPQMMKGRSGRDGWGIKMGCWAGGFIESHPRSSMATIMAQPGPFGTTPLLHLNARGKRFMNEGMGPYFKQNMIRQPHGNIYSITDANWFESIKVAGCDHGAPIFGIYPGQHDTMIENMSHVVEAGEEGYDVLNTSQGRGVTGKVWGAETLEELMDLLGLEGEDKETALAEIAHYNELCYAGVDSDYGKDACAMIPIDTPPFYGSKKEHDGTSTASLVTFCGLVTDDHMNVVKGDYTPIKGLYAAGNSLGCRWGGGYSAPVAGSSIGFAMTHGRVLGKYLAAL